MEEIARALGLEADRFVRAFRASIGKSIHLYLDERRVDEKRTRA